MVKKFYLEYENSPKKPTREGEKFYIIGYDFSVMNAQTQPAFLIGTIPIHGRFVLAPMDGYTDSPMRRLAKRYGSAISYSEFVNALDVVHGHPHLDTLTTFFEEERPFVYQIYDDNPERFLVAAQKLVYKKPNIIDINIGCSAKNVSNRGAGAGLLKTPEKIEQIATLLVKNLPVPVTAKIRLGWDDDSLNYLQVAHILEDCGISLITVHGRTRKQEYGGEANWQAIAEVKAAVKVPVLGNGDVKTYADGLRLMQQTGCDGVMVGRAAIGNPWIFANSDRSLVSKEEIYNVLSWHLNEGVALYGPNVAVPMFRKHLIRYLQGYLPTSDIRRHIFNIAEAQVLLDEIKKLMEL